MNKIKANLDEAKDEVGELKSLFDDLVLNDRHDKRIYNWLHFQTCFTHFMTEEIEKVVDAMDAAAREIERLECEVEKLNKQLDNYEEIINGEEGD